MNKTHSLHFLPKTGDHCFMKNKKSCDGDMDMPKKKMKGKKKGKMAKKESAEEYQESKGQYFKSKGLKFE